MRSAVGQLRRKFSYLQSSDIPVLCPLGSNAFLSKHRATVFAAVAPEQVIRVLNDSLVNFGWSGFLLAAGVLPHLFHEVACNKPVQACRKYSLRVLRRAD